MCPNDGRREAIDLYFTVSDELIMVGESHAYELRLSPSIIPKSTLSSIASLMTASKSLFFFVINELLRRCAIVFECARWSLESDAYPLSISLVISIAFGRYCNLKCSMKYSWAILISLVELPFRLVYNNNKGAIINSL